jgi:hypothetical protein
MFEICTTRACTTFSTTILLERIGLERRTGTAQRLRRNRRDNDTHMAGALIFDVWVSLMTLGMMGLGKDE